MKAASIVYAFLGPLLSGFIISASIINAYLAYFLLFEDYVPCESTVPFPDSAGNLLLLFYILFSGGSLLSFFLGSVIVLFKGKRYTRFQRAKLLLVRGLFGILLSFLSFCVLQMELGLFGICLTEWGSPI